MPTLSSPGIGSGLDTKAIVEQLMAAERQPVVRLDGRRVELQAQVSAYGSLKSAVSSFRDAVEKLSDLSKFKVYAATSSDKNIIDATASSAAARGTYSLVVNRIAENHRLAAGTTLVDSGVTKVGAVGDTMTIAVGTAAFTVDSGDKTLAQIRDAINQATDNAGVTASIIKDNVGYRLSLSANATGSAKVITATYSGADPFAFTTLNADRDGSGGFTAADLDASLRLEGQFNITSTSNSLTDAIEGVTLTLKQAGAVTLNVSRDNAAVETAVRGIVKGYSDLVSTMSKMRGQVLKSDSPVLANLETQLRAVLNRSSTTTSIFGNVFQLGVSTLKSGSLELDSKALASALGTDFDGVATLFADPAHGIAKQLQNLADSFLATGGALDGRAQSLNSEIKQTDARKIQLEQRLAQVQLRYTQQFGSLDSVISSLNRTGSLVTQQLTALANATTYRR